MKTSLPILSLLSALTLLFAGCGTPQATRPDPAPDSPAGRVWILASIDGEALDLPEGAQVPDLHFSADGLSVAGFTGVNGFGGQVRLGEEQLFFGPLSMTRRAGPADLMQIENRYTSALTKVSGWRIEHRELQLLRKDKVVLTFQLQLQRVQL